MPFKVGIVGAAGYAGIELLRILLAHPCFEVVSATSDANAETPIAQMYPAFMGKTDLRFSTVEEAELKACDAVFLAVPHTAALAIAPELLDAGVSVFDLSADFRLKNADVYEKWYKTPHTAPDLLKRAAFGLPEITGSELARAAEDRAAGKAALVACAGCYPTATSLAAAPAIKAGIVDPKAAVIVDAISGVTGAGKKPKQRNLFCSANENFEAYGVANHRHTPEIEQILNIEGRLVFTPHLAPTNRGLLSTVNMPLADNCEATTDDIHEIYAKFYSESPFVTVLEQGVFPRTDSVAGTNRAHVGIAVNERARVLISISAIDNLGKGAAAQSVQCANIVFGLPETEGLENMALPV